MVSQLSPTEVAALLQKENIISDEGIRLIVKNKIDGQALLLLETEHFKEIGIEALGDRIKLGNFISKHRTTGTAAAQACVSDLRSVSNFTSARTKVIKVNASTVLQSFFHQGAASRGSCHY